MDGWRERESPPWTSSWPASTFPQKITAWTTTTPSTASIVRAKNNVVKSGRLGCGDYSRSPEAGLGLLSVGALSLKTLPYSALQKKTLGSENRENPKKKKKLPSHFNSVFNIKKTALKKHCICCINLVKYLGHYQISIYCELQTKSHYKKISERKCQNSSDNSVIITPYTTSTQHNINV